MLMQSVSSLLRIIILSAIIVFPAVASIAQMKTQADSLSPNTSRFKQKEHIVPIGNQIHKLPQGLPFAAFNKGGKKEKALDDFIREQKVAGLIILQDGKVRLERYALGHSRSNRWSSLSVAKSVTGTR